MPKAKASKTSIVQEDELDKVEAAALIGTSPAYVYDLHQAGKLVGFYRSARKLRFTRQAVLDYIAARDAGKDKGAAASSEAATTPPASAGVSGPPLAQGEPMTSIPVATLTDIYQAREWAVRTADTTDALTKAQMQERLRMIAELLPKRTP